MEVKLWYANNDENKVVYIYDAVKEAEYKCPVCGSKVVPKALNSEKITAHFAHYDKSKCSNEAMLHWWFKNKYIEQGDTFKIDGEEHVCKEIRVEPTIRTEYGNYKPDLEVETEDDEIIYFEMYNTSKKDVDKYFLIWNELNNKVVEVNIKDVMDSSKNFKSLYNDGKVSYKRKTYNCYERHVEYSSTNRNKLNWVYIDLMKYKNNEITLEDLMCSFEGIDRSGKYGIIESMKQENCLGVYEKYLSDFKQFLDKYLKCKYEVDGDDVILLNPYMYNNSFNILATKEDIDKQYNIFKDCNYRGSVVKRLVKEGFPRIYEDVKLNDDYSLFYSLEERCTEASVIYKYKGANLFKVCALESGIEDYLAFSKLVNQKVKEYNDNVFGRRNDNQKVIEKEREFRNCVENIYTKEEDAISRFTTEIVYESDTLCFIKVFREYHEKYKRYTTKHKDLEYSIEIKDNNIPTMQDLVGGFEKMLKTEYRRNKIWRF